MVKQYMPPYEFFRKLIGFDLVYTEQPKVVPVRTDLILNLLWNLALSSGYRSDFYLKNNPDIKESPLGIDGHFITTGYMENRLAIDLDFDEDYYLKKYPDVKEEVLKGNFENGRTHFFNQGYNEFRCPHPEYEEFINAWKFLVEK